MIVRGTGTAAIGALMMLSASPALAETACHFDPAALEAQMQAHGAAIRRGDIEAIMADFTPDARIVGPGSDLRGAGEIRRQTIDALAKFEMAPNNSIDSVEFIGPWAFQEGPYQETARNRETGEETSTEGTWLTLYRCDTATGRWLFHRIMWQ